MDAFDDVRPAVQCRDVLVPPVARALGEWDGAVPVEDVRYVDTDPERADTAVLARTYGEWLVEVSGNCVVVAGRRGGETTLAGCLVLATTRADVNGAVRRRLGARKVSFASMNTAVLETGMEYGGITPIGLPEGWPLLVDEAVVNTPLVLVGSGARRGKLIVPGKAFADLPGAEVLTGLAS